nr:reverse transcriptase domain-containing protein [Tanacetum cinerariifolium]
WLDKEPPRSILTWEDLVSKFINQFFPPSKTTYLRNEIINFLQKPNETFNEAWEHFKDLLRQCLHHGFSELHQLDTFYNALNPNDQDALDLAAGGNFLDKIPRECLSIIESKSKVRYSRSRVTDMRVSTNAPLPSSSPSYSFDIQQIAASLEDKLDIRMNRFEKSLNDMKAYFVTPTAPIKVVEECMHTRSSYFPITTNVTIPRRRQRKQTSNIIEPEIRTIIEMADNRTMAQMLQALIEGYEDAIVVSPINANNFELKQTLINLVQSNQFTDALDSAAGGNFLDRIPRDGLSIIESKSKVRYSQSRMTDSRVSTNAPLLSSSSPSHSFDLQQIVASLKDKLDIRMNRFEKYLNDMKAFFVTPTAPI